MTKKTPQLIAITLPLSIALSACAGWDNPTALSELQLEVEFEIGSPQLETFEEVEIHVHVTESGAPLRMGQGQLEIKATAGGPVRIVELEPEGDSYTGHVTFFVPGDHHLHFMAVPEGHHLMAELGEHEVSVDRQHRVIGPYWVELAVSPAPVSERESAHIHFYAYDLLSDGTRGAPAIGLDMEVEVHDPSGAESAVAVREEAGGEYEAEFSFTVAGVYEFHVAIDVGTEHVDGEFHLPVLSLTDDSDTGPDTGGDHGH